MAPISIFAEKTIASKNDSIRTMLVVIEGSCIAKFAGGSISLGKGDILGVIDMFSGEYSCDYIATTDCILLPYPFGNCNQFLRLVYSKADLAHLVFSSLMRQTTNLLKVTNSFLDRCNKLTDLLTTEYDNYKAACAIHGIPFKAPANPEVLKPISLEENVESWMQPYFEALMGLDKNIKQTFYANPALISGLLNHASQIGEFAKNTNEIIMEHFRGCMDELLNESKMDFLSWYISFATKVASKGKDASEYYANVERYFKLLEESGFIDNELLQGRLEEFHNLTMVAASADTNPDTDVDIDVLDNSLDAICEYGAIDSDTRDRLKENLDLFNSLTDKAAPDEASRKLRQALTKDFYKVYTEVILNSLENTNLPPAVNMFINFGYMDQRLVAEDNLKYLLALSQGYHGAPDYGIYTILEWMKAIYSGKKEPSKNEFDLDFPAYIKEQRVQGNITKDEEANMLNDNREKVLFELNNMFPVSNKMTSGQVTTFCPILSEHNILKDLKDSLITPEKIANGFRKIKSIDFSAFFRETVYSDTVAGVPKEFVKVDVNPDIILTPCVGNRGAMWQEIEGKVRTTHARMILPTFFLDNPIKILTRLTGEFRWEMCKRVQGARWNDVSDRSLTSEYCDYVQFYRKNSDLSTDAKEKIKNNLSKCRNSFKEMFVRDYMEWIFYEGEGSPRLNKVARAILMRYCPFGIELRNQFKEHPIWSDGIRQYDRKNAQTVQHLKVLCDKLTKEGHEIPHIIEAQVAITEL